VELQLALLLVMMLLASVTTFHVSRRWYVPLALIWTLAFVLFGRLIGLTWAQMGLTDWVMGLVWGGGAVLIVSLGMAAGVAIPRLHPLFADERVLSASPAQVAHKSLVEVPLGTVALEEIVFRSVLLGLLTKYVSQGLQWSHATAWGVAGSAFLFGLWHILPALEMHDSHSMASALGSGWRGKVTTVLGTILATGSAGVLFAMLVVWSGSVLAPMGLHWAMNSTGSVAAWLVGRRIARDAAATATGDPADPDAG
jgi:membrane protease YdiL (CAAX protease family)